MSDDLTLLDLTLRKRYMDWVGLSGLEENIATGVQLEVLAGLDPDHWRVAAMTINPSCSTQQRDDIYLYALNRDATGIGAVTRLEKYGRDRTAIPVTRIHLCNTDTRAVLAQMKSAKLHFRAVALQDVPLYVSESDRHQGVCVESHLES